jgi:ubiquinone/menaquinone biosynthesis C-methylase UbiE
MIKEQLFDQFTEPWNDRHLGESVKIERLVSMIGLCEGDRVLCVGCGTARLIPFIRKLVGFAGRITAVEFSANMIALAAVMQTTLKGIEYRVYDTMDYQRDYCFNKITCWNFFSHIFDKEAFLLEMEEILGDGGALVIMNDIPRDIANRIRKDSQIVKNGRIPQGGETATLMIEAGYSVTEIIDSEEMCFIKALKERS